MNTLTFDQVNIGHKERFSRKFSREDIEIFTRLSGDHNPLHTDQNYAESTEMGGTIIHGMFAASQFSTLVGMYLPGKYCLYLSQILEFRRPIYPDKEIFIEGEVIQKFDSLKIIEIETKIFSELGDLLISGKARVKILR